MQHPNDLFPSHYVLFLECGLLALFILWATVRVVGGGASLRTPIDARRLERISRSSRLPRSNLGLCSLAAVLGLLGNAAISLTMGFAGPNIDDARAYQITAETFAAGRITNPAPPHPALVPEQVLAVPTYNGKYPPGQGLFLAIGTALGEPGLSLWLGSALLPAAILWCLLGWLPRRWALVGALLALLRLAVGSYWNHSYWGGTVAALGSALVIGGLGRQAFRRPSAPLRSWPALGAGLGILALSRPYEGFAVALPILGWLGFRIWRAKPPARRRALSETALAVAIVLPFVSFLAYYNAKVGGSVYPFPHQVYEEHRPVAGEFVWDRWINSQGRMNWNDLDLPPEERRGWWRASARQFVHRAVSAPYFLIGPALFLALLLAAPRVGPGLLWLSILSVLLAHSLVHFHFPHYSAPMTAQLCVLGVTAMRLLTLRPPQGFRQARWLLPAAFAIESLSLVVQIPALREHETEPLSRQAVIERELSAAQGEHLILVVFEEASVFNGRDLEGPVLWAYDYGPESTAELLQLYPRRRFWYFDPRRPDLVPIDHDDLLAKTRDPQSYLVGGRDPRLRAGAF